MAALFCFCRGNNKRPDTERQKTASVSKGTKAGMDCILPPLAYWIGVFNNGVPDFITGLMRFKGITAVIWQNMN